MGANNNRNSINEIGMFILILANVSIKILFIQIYTKIDLGAVLHYTDLDWKSDLSPMTIPQDSDIF